MSLAPKYDLTITQGEDFSEVFSWAVEPLVWKPITAASKAAPCVMTVATSGIVDGWPIWVESVVGMVQLNQDHTKDDPYKATRTDANTITLNNVNALGFDTYVSGGTIAYYTPVDMTGYTARCQLRASPGAAAALLSLTTENGGIALDNTLKTITLKITNAQSALLTFQSCLYELEMIAPTTLLVTKIARGVVRLVKESTK